MFEKLKLPSVTKHLKRSRWQIQFRCYPCYNNRHWKGSTLDGTCELNVNTINKRFSRRRNQVMAKYQQEFREHFEGDTTTKKNEASDK